MTTLLRAQGISKSFAGVQALKGVSFDLRAGEVHALVGENGAGKSTLIKVMTGAHRPDAGTLEIAGQAVDHNDPATARDLGVAAIYQQPALFPDLSVAENIAIGLEGGGPWRWVNWGARKRRARALLDRVGARVDPDREVRALSMPEQQLVEIARALGANARVLIMDEPTASLSEREVAELLRVVRELKTQGVGVLYISHRLEELEQVADRVTVLRDGETIATLPIAQADRAKLVSLMVGRALTAIFPKVDVPLGAVALELRGVGCSALGVREVSFSVRAGEIVGLAGLVGAGRTELAEALFGLERVDSGTVSLDGRAVTIDSPETAIDLGIAYVPEDRRRHGVILDMSVTANASLAILKRLARGGWLDFARERDLAADFVSRLAVKTASLDAPVGDLSGGNQQKVALARWLATAPKVMVLDEPTQGVDVGAKAEVHRLMGDLAARGLAIILISSELPELLGMSDRVVVLHAGTVVGELDRATATQERVLALALGHAPEAPTGSDHA